MFFPRNPKAKCTAAPSEELNCQRDLICANLPGVAAVLISTAFLNFLVVDAGINNYMT